MENKTIYLVYNGEVKALDVLKETKKLYILEHNYFVTNLRKVDVGTVYKRGMSPNYDAVFSFDRNKAIQVYNEHLQFNADWLLSYRIKEGN